MYVKPATAAYCLSKVHYGTYIPLLISGVHLFKPFYSSAAYSTAKV
jgi:hypothetical protein